MRFVCLKKKQTKLYTYICTKFFLLKKNQNLPNNIFAIFKS